MFTMTHFATHKNDNLWKTD